MILTLEDNCEAKVKFDLAKTEFDLLTLDEKTFSFSKYSEKMIFPKKIALEYDFSCIIRKNDISFPQKDDIIL